MRKLVTAWFLSALLIVLIGVSSGVYLLVSRYLHRSTIDSLRGQVLAGWFPPKERMEPIHPHHRLRLRLGPEDQWPAIGELATPRFWVRYCDPSGATLAQAGGPKDPPQIPSPKQRVTPPTELNPIYWSHNHHERMMVLEFPVESTTGSAAGTLQVGVGTRPSDDLLAALAGYLFLTSAAALFIGGWTARVVAGRLLRPLERLATATQEVASGQIGTRVGSISGPREVRSLAADFDQMMDRLEQSMETQKRFVADASHELKTPLTSIGALSEMLVMPDEHFDSKRRERALSTIFREVQRMNGLVGDLLTLSRTESGIPKIEVCSLKQPLEALIEDYRHSRPDLVLEIGPEPCLARIEVSLWERVVRNLIDNAIRHTSSGPEQLSKRSGEQGVTVSLRSDKQIQLIVKDTGCGIEAEALEHVFERFYRADRSRSRESGGSGLGLAIVRSIAEAAGGSVSIESTIGQGTTVTVLLPKAEVYS